MYWFLLWNQTAISKPPVLHTDVQLELGDLFINQFHSKKHQAQVIQVWLLVKESGSNRYTWKQVRDMFISLLLVVPNCAVTKVEPNEQIYHPKLMKRILSFQPNVAQTNPMWILPDSNRRSRSSPIIVCGSD
jgi:hypothetical protein